MSEVERTFSNAAMPRPCWSCKGPVGRQSLFCATCNAVQPAGDLDHFARLGLERGFALDPALLDRHYFQLQRCLHPDRFSRRPARERALSQGQAAALNEAYETLKDPMRRSAYLLHLAGRDADIDKNATVSDPALLMEAMEMREALAEAADQATAGRLLAEAEDAVSGCLTALAKAFADNDLDAAGRLTTRMRYLARLVEEARARRSRLMTEPVS